MFWNKASAERCFRAAGSLVIITLFLDKLADCTNPSQITAKEVPPSPPRPDKNCWHCKHNDDQLGKTNQKTVHKFFDLRTLQTGSEIRSGNRW